MSKLARILALIFLAAFTASTASHAAASTDMSLKMSMTDMDGGGMADCQDCPDDGPASVCDQFCLTAFAALCAPAAAELLHVAGAVSFPHGELPDGRTGPPEPYPPRTTFLN